MSVRFWLFTVMLLLAAVSTGFAYSDADLVFSVNHNDLGTSGSVISSWGVFTKTGAAGTDPTVQTLTNTGTGISVKWCRPVASILTGTSTTTPGSGFTSPTIGTVASGIAHTGFTIVTAVIPSNNTSGSGEYRSIVNVYLGMLGLYQMDNGTLAIRLQNHTGNASTNDGYTTGAGILSDGIPTVISMTVTTGGYYEVWIDTVVSGVTVSNKVLYGTCTNFGSYANPLTWSSTTTTLTNRNSIGLGSQGGTSSPSGTSFRGYIGDTYLYKTAVTNAERIQLVNNVEINMGMLPSGNTYTITASAGANGSISPSGAVSVNSGASQMFTITPNTGYAVSDVLVDGASVGAVSTYTFNNVTANHTISASFVALPSFTITASAGANGSISPSGAVTVYQGTNKTFTITANTGYQISQVLVDGENAGAVATYTFSNITADHTISASFTPVPTFTITASAGANGSISPSGSVVVNQGSNQTFSITPNTGYGVSDVLVDGASVGAVTTYTFNTVTANHTISASFVALPTFTITASAGANGSISPSGAVSVVQGASQTFNFTPNAGYQIDTMTVDGSAAGSASSYTFTNVTANHTISVTFVQQALTSSLVMELRPQDFNGTQWPIYQGSLKDANPSLAYFAYSGGAPKLIPSVAGTKHSGVSMNMSVWDQCTGLGGPIAPSTITGTNPRTIEVWSYNPSLAGEETLVDLSHKGGTTGQHFALENGNNWALNGSGTADVTDWNSTTRANRWVHLVVTYENGLANFYVDGVLTTSKAITYDIFAGDSIAIGAQRNAATTASNSTNNLNVAVYIGYLGNIRIYNKALTQAEVGTRFNLGVNGGEVDASTFTISGKVADGATGVSGALVYFSKSAGASLDPTYVTTTDSSGNYTYTLPSGQWYVAASKGRYTPNPTADTSVLLFSNTTGINFSLTYVSTPTKLIDMDATTISGNDNDPISTWSNAGTLGGAFGLDGGDTTTRPILGTVLGKRCLTFDGVNDRLKLLNGANPINTPAGLAGNSDWSVCGWYLNPALASTECTLCWASSGDGLGARCAFMYGSHNGDGAVMHGASPWLNANMAIIPLPTTGLWHHIAVSFDGTTEKVYVDGAVNQTEAKNLRLSSGEPFMMAANYGTNTGANPSTYYSGSIASMTVYDQVLTDAEISALGTQVTYRISGTVKDNTNQPISGALVYFNTASPANVSPVLVATTDSTGAYTQEVPPGNWYVSAMKSRYTPNPTTDILVPVISGNVTGQNFVLNPDNTLHKLIDLDASSLNVGAVSNWTNSGMLGGSFAQDGTDSTTNPTAVIVAGKKAVTFDGSNDRLLASFTAPSGITADSDWTVSAIVYNPSIATEEAYLCWAQRGTVSRAAEFCYSTTYSANHTTTKMGWTSVPTAGVWHHVAVTYDGSVEKTYVDGILSAQAVPTYLNIWTGQPVFLGTAYDNSSGTTKSQWFSGSIASLQVYDEALTISEVQAIATVTISGSVKGPDGNPLAGAIVGFKSTAKTTVGQTVSATADADIYVTTDGYGNYSMPVLIGTSYYLAAWKDAYTPSSDVLVNADVSKTVDLTISDEAGVNIALGKDSTMLAASTTGIGTYPATNAFDGSPSTYFYWNTSSQKDLVIDTSDSGAAQSINGITLINDSYRVYDWELWVENNAAPIVGGARNTSANWTRIYSSTGSFGGYDRSAVNGQVIDPVKFASTNARGVWIKITSGSNAETRLLEVMVHSSAGPASVGSFKNGSMLNKNVILSGKSVTWAPRNGNGVRISNYFYVEDLDRTSGIRIQLPVSMTDSVKVNDLVSIAGKVKYDSSIQEYYIEPTIAPVGSTGSGIAPHCMNTKAVQHIVANGRYVSVSGKVISLDTDGFYISDGYMPTKVIVQGVQLPANLAAVNDMITVYGVVSRAIINGTAQSVILMFNYNKVTPSTPGEVTFFTISDIHYGVSGTIQGVNQTDIDVMNALPGTAYPSSIGGYVQNPRALIEIGDIADGGTAAQFDQFAADYGLNGECRLRYPVYEGLGNHDGRVTGTVGLKIKARNQLRRNLTAISTNGMHYSWDWNGIHFVDCNVAPTDINEGNMAGDVNYALQFLKEDLPKNVGNSGRPVIIFHHWGFEAFSATWWTDNERSNYYNVIKDYNVIAIVHGHTHTAGTYKWNNIDVYQDGSGHNDPNPGGFFVFRVKSNKLDVAQRVFNTSTMQWNWGMTFTKTFTWPAAAPQSLEPEVIPAQ